MNQNITFSIYKLEESKSIEEIYNNFSLNFSYPYEEVSKKYKYKLKSKDNIKNWNFESENYKYFYAFFEIERPARELKNGTNFKEVKIFFFENSKKEIYILPFFNDVSLHIVIRVILSKYDYKFYKVISDNSKNLFSSWLHKFCRDEKVFENFKITSVKSYKCTSNDQKSTFKGRTDATIAESIELRQKIIYDQEFKNLKFAITYKNSYFDFTLSFTEEEYYKLSYFEKNLEGTLFKAEEKIEELLIFIVDFLIPKLKINFILSKWDNKKHQEYRKILINEFKTELNQLEEIIAEENFEEKIEENCDIQKISIKKEETKNKSFLFQ